MPPRPTRDLMPSELARLVEVRRVGTERADELAVTLTAAFADDPFGQFMLRGVTDEDAHAKLWHYAVTHIGRGVELLASETSSAVALWEPPAGSVPAVSPPDGESGEQGGYQRLLAEFVGETRAAELTGFMGTMVGLRPAEPHWYLAAIGVHPDAQNRGWGAKLMAPVLRRCDRMGLPVYLESTNPKNHSFYARFGFAGIGVTTAPDGPEVVRFLRAAQA